MTDQPTIAEREASSILQTYGRYPLTLVRGEGCRVYDETGQEYLDCLAGIAVASLGHANAAVAARVARQMTKLVHVSNLYYTQPQVELAERLKDLSGLDRVFFANCGATANETAIKLARRWGQKTRGAECYEIVSLLDSFHGRTLAALAATGQPKKQAIFEPLPTGFVQVAAHDIDALAEVIGPQTAGVMIETIQGEGGVIPIEKGYMQELRELCDRHDVLLIIDDIQAGIGRTGTWFSWQQLEVDPDIATLAKALANGLPIGACLSTERAAAFDYGEHGTTFGGGPVVTSAALAVLEEIEARDLLENCRNRGRQLASLLTALPGVSEVRGRGLMLGAVLDSPRAAEVNRAALSNGLLVNNVAADTVRFTPPLIITEEEVNEAVSKFSASLQAGSEW
ncbi:MAG: acetylornithine transaminase [Acidimicrobiia bacterium]|nr:acetylornithine transaminase [bacterium]MXZ06811.1 acetylornithine transaminase [Acidimicrobiia bacterium]MYD04743.1 acetylornithine transaminase [Acidimicrobiia bacterium]MYF26415.1 acetylornithine transaminase [Acidimicrobiia bacterium]